MDQWSNGPIVARKQWTKRPKDQWTNEPMVPKISPRYPQDISKISPRYPQYITKISPRYPQDIPKISPRYPQDIPKIPPRYPQNITKMVVWSGLVWSGLVWSGLVWSGLVHQDLPRPFRTILNTQTYMLDWTDGLDGLDWIPEPPDHKSTAWAVLISLVTCLIRVFIWITMNLRALARKEEDATYLCSACYMYF